MFQFGPTWGIKDEEIMEKFLYTVTLKFWENLIPILFCYIFQVIGQ